MVLGLGPRECLESIWNEILRLAVVVRGRGDESEAESYKITFPSELIIVWSEIIHIHCRPGAPMTHFLQETL